jgi:hypothetical protein
MTETPRVFKLTETYAQLRPDGSSTAWSAHEFWKAVVTDRLPEEPAGFGQLVSCYEFDSDWTNWERHPGGDELVCLLAGEMDVILEGEQGDVVVQMKEHDTCIVPRGVWHRAVVHKPARTLHVTPGEGTEHREID